MKQIQHRYFKQRTTAGLKHRGIFIWLPHPCSLALFSAHCFLAPLPCCWHLQEFSRITLVTCKMYRTNLFSDISNTQEYYCYHQENNCSHCWVTLCFVKDEVGPFINSLSLYLQHNATHTPARMCAGTVGAWVYGLVPSSVTDRSVQPFTSLQLPGVSVSRRKRRMSQCMWWLPSTALLPLLLHVPLLLCPTTPSPPPQAPTQKGKEWESEYSGAGTVDNVCLVWVI